MQHVKITLCHLTRKLFLKLIQAWSVVIIRIDVKGNVNLYIRQAEFDTQIPEFDTQIPEFDTQISEFDTQILEFDTQIPEFDT